MKTRKLPELNDLLFRMWAMKPENMQYSYEELAEIWRKLRRNKEDK